MLDTLPQQREEITTSNREMTLHPAQTLSGRSFERQRLFIIYLGIVIKSWIYVALCAAHGEFQILYETCCTPAHFLKQICFKAHACTTEEISHVQIVT
ncbi:hypothetical protein D3C74_163020 [compost metagenome]